MDLRKVLENQISELEKMEANEIGEASYKAEAICKVINTILLLPKKAPEVEAQELKLKAETVIGVLQNKEE